MSDNWLAVLAAKSNKHILSQPYASLGPASKKLRDMLEPDVIRIENCSEEDGRLAIRALMDICDAYCGRPEPHKNRGHKIAERALKSIGKSNGA